MKSSRLLSLVALVLFVASACGGEDPPDGPTSCIINEECDPGFVCGPELFCVAASDTGQDTGQDTEEDPAVDVEDTTPDVPDTEDVGEDPVLDATDTVEADATDTVEADADAVTPDTGEPVCTGETCCAPSGRNACGGCLPLELDGQRMSPGDECGACGGGVVTCGSPNTLRCSGANDSNVCGTCAVLEAEPSTACGVCGGGALICDSESPMGIACEGGTNNGCGGCGAVAGLPGTVCTADDGFGGQWVCTGADDVVCMRNAGNRCGGDEVLRYKDEAAQPGDLCGAALNGALICDGTNALACTVSDPGNTCGGTAPLAGAPGASCTKPTACGDVTGVWTCADSPVGEAVGVEQFDGVFCYVENLAATRDENACGGCTELAEEVGSACGNSNAGRWTCDGAEGVTCLEPQSACDGDAAPNLCGGCNLLLNPPGRSCGTCDSGVYVCTGANSTECADAGDESLLNACGGCAQLDYEGIWANPDDSCGPCGSGTLVCDSDDFLRCDGAGDASLLNTCGGCATLSVEPGGICGTCDSGTYRCSVDGDDVSCAGDIGVEGLNVCGGCAPMDETPGETCGTCGSGTTVCNAALDGVECTGDEGDDALNECGGCDTIDGAVGDACGTCDTGTLACGSSMNDLVCNDDAGGAALNACGGCTELDTVVGESCGPCNDGAWACDGTDGMTCVGAALAPNACGGCGTLETDVGAACGECGAGATVCNGPNDLRCSDADGLNECGTCGFVSVPLDEPCGACDSGRYICVIDGAQCWGIQTNACGGCNELDGWPGNPCGSGGTLTCDGTNALTCTTGEALNACGGSTVLMYNGFALLPGDPCGRQNEAALRCGGPETLECPVEDGANACGGDAMLAGDPGQACTRPTGCGPVEGVWACADEALLGRDAFDGVVCVSDDPSYNACGGCSSLPLAPGDICEDGGIAQCDGLNDVRCVEDSGGGCSGATNLCGGCSALPRYPGDLCGTCNLGRWACTGPEEVSCVGDPGSEFLNDCGGCNDLIYNAVPATVGDPCACGTATLTCRNSEQLECDESGVTLNACGGCATLTAAPEDPCGTCGTGTYTCASDRNSLICENDAGSFALNECGGCGVATNNSCGGCAVLEGEPGNACGTCGTGVWTCDGSTSVECVGADDPSTLNACGGCGTLEGNIGDACGTCGLGTLQCSADNGALICRNDPGSSVLNECGGCSELDDGLNSPCGTCGSGTVQCDGTDATQCLGDNGATAENVCGGCATIDETLNEVCGVCDSGRWQCDGTEAVTCAGDGGEERLNSCGGCFGLPGEPGDSCGVCGSGQWQCDGEENVVCVGAEANNECGGCTELEGSVGDDCGTCDTGRLACDGTEAYTCEGDEGTEALNDCGGCSLLPTEGTSCGGCGSGTWLCVDEETMDCDGDLGVDARNACEGCGELPNTPGTQCGACETEVWTCSSATTVTCDTTSDPCPTCDDEIRNQDETDVDCGGSICGGCALGELCLVPGDCDGVGAECTDNACVPPPACDDGIMNGTETDIDCGGTCEEACEVGLSCGGTPDCQGTATCVSGTCTPVAQSNPWIAFQAADGGLPKVYLVRADGTDLTQLNIPGDLLQEDPAFSPDGTMLAYRAFAGGSSVLRTVELATGTTNDITHGLSNLVNIAWSPAGDALICEGDGVDGTNNDLYIIPLDGSGAYPAPATNGQGEAAPDWVRSNLVYYVTNSGGFDVWSRTIDGSIADTRVTTGSRIVGGASVSWDLGWMTFRRSLSSTTGEVVRYEVSTDTLHTFGTGEASSPVISPDGQWIAYVDEGNGGFGTAGQKDIFWVSLATGVVQRAVTNDDVVEASLAISPGESGALWLLAP